MSANGHGNVLVRERHDEGRIPEGGAVEYFQHPLCRGTFQVGPGRAPPVKCPKCGRRLEYEDEERLA